jgi:hypothetical protein
MSQDHINENLATIASIDADRVGIYGLVSSDGPRHKSIYVHSKLLIVDDERMLIGSANMDNMSLFKASEFAFRIDDPKIASETRHRLWTEHLSPHFGDFIASDTHIDRVLDFEEGFQAFRRISDKNLEQARSNTSGPLLGRPVSLVPAENYRTVKMLLSSSNPWAQFASKLGLPHAEELVNRLAKSGHATESGFFLQSML